MVLLTAGETKAGLVDTNVLAAPWWLGEMRLVDACHYKYHTIHVFKNSC